MIRAKHIALCAFCLAFWVYSNQALAAQSSISSPTSLPYGDMHVVEYVLTAHSTNGEYSAHTTKALDGLLLSVETDPAPYSAWRMSNNVWAETSGSSAAYSPTDLYDVTLTDVSAFDVMGGALANRSQSTTEATMPLKNGNYCCVPIHGPLSINITGNTTNSAAILFRFYYVPTEI